MTDDQPDKPKKPEPRRPGGKTKRGPNKWLLRIYRGLDTAGRRIYYSEIFHGGSREADDRLVELRNNHKAGRPLKFEVKTFGDFFDKWLDDCKAAGLPETFMLKSSRHSCASALLNDPEVPIKAISDRLGHASIAITADVYGVTEDDRQREVSERVGRLFGIGKK